MGVFAHPDDEFAIAGLIRKALSCGVEVHLVTATRGEAGRIQNEKKLLLGKMGPADIRVAESIDSCKQLKVTQSYFLGLPDGASEN